MEQLGGRAPAGAGVDERADIVLRAVITPSNGA